MEIHLKMDDALALTLRPMRKSWPRTGTAWCCTQRAPSCRAHLGLMRTGNEYSRGSNTWCRRTDTGKCSVQQPPNACANSDTGLERTNV